MAKHVSTEVRKQAVKSYGIVGISCLPLAFFFFIQKMNTFVRATTTFFYPLSIEIEF